MYYLPQFRCTIQRVISDQELYSRTAVRLLLGTCAVETDFGTYLRQRPSGPGRGAFSCELGTERDAWINYLKFRPERRRAITRISGVFSFENNGALEGNLFYAICIARIHYRRIPEPFPDVDDIEGLARYWDIHYNCNPEKGTVQDFMIKWERYIVPWKKYLNL